MKINKVLNRIKCWLGIHKIVYKAWADEFPGSYVRRYHSMRHCEFCDFIESHKSDVC